MLTLYIRNVKTVNGIADYKYIVMVNAEMIAEGEIREHNKGDGWRPLVQRIVDDEPLRYKNKEEK